MVGRWNFFLGPIFRCYISFRECNLWSLSCCVISRWGHAPGGMHKSSSSLAAVVEVWALQKTWNAPSFSYKSEARSSIGRELWGRVPKTLIHNSYWGFAPFAVQKNCWTSPIPSPKSAQSATPFRFPLEVIRSELEAFTSKTSRCRKQTDVEPHRGSHRIHFRNGNILTTTLRSKNQKDSKKRGRQGKGNIKPQHPCMVYYCNVYYLRTFTININKNQPYMYR